MISIKNMVMPDGTEFRIGSRVQHIDGWAGTITDITAHPVGVGGIRIKTDPDDLDAARKSGVHWPLQGGGQYIEARNSGLMAHRFTALENKP